MRGRRFMLDRHGELRSPRAGIAAHAMALNVTLVTNNTKNFGRAPGLKAVNWFSGVR